MKGDYQLGIEGAANYQPSFGRWELSEKGDTLIQNPVTPFVVKYKIIELKENVFVQSSMPYMATANWPYGSWVCGIFYRILDQGMIPIDLMVSQLLHLLISQCSNQTAKSIFNSSRDLH